MARKTNDIEKFWHELKRRKTGKVIIAYAATAFILLQLADLLTPALLLPEWTTRLVTLILIVGFPIAIIFSWVFDITPEGIKKTESVEESENKEIVTKLVKRIFHVSNIIIASLIIVVGILAYPKVFKPNTLENLRAKGRISIAVMPFQNMTNDTTWNVWQDGIQNELITSLTNFEELKVRQIESITGLLRSKGLTNYASITPSFASNISRKLDANAIISGTIKRAGATIRVNAQLIDPKSEEVFKTFQIDGTSENEILSIIDSLSIRIKDFLLISGLEKKLGQDAPMFITTKSSEAFRYYLNGYQALYKLDCPTAINWFLMALKIDSTFVHAMSLISYSYGLQDLYIEAKDWALKAHEFKNRVPISQQLSIDLNYATYFETPNEEIKYEKQLLELDNQLPFTYYRLGYSYNNLFQFKKAIPEFQKSLEIYKRWGTKPRWIYNYIMLGLAYHKIEQFSKENKIYAKTEHDFPNDLLLIVPRQAILALSEGKLKKANYYIEKYISIHKENSASEAKLALGLAEIYLEADIQDKAEKYYRQALSTESENSDLLNAVAYFLIDKDRNLKEGMDYIDRALKSSPDNYNYLHTKGWGLFKQGNYRDALELLQKSWDLRRQYAEYDHVSFLHLEAAKKAVAGQKN